MEEILNKTTLFVICVDLLFFFFFGLLDPNNPKSGPETRGAEIPHFRLVLLLAVVGGNLWYFLNQLL